MDSEIGHKENKFYQARLSKIKVQHSFIIHFYLSLGLVQNLFPLSLKANSITPQPPSLSATSISFKPIEELCLEV